MARPHSGAARRADVRRPPARDQPRLRSARLGCSSMAIWNIRRTFSSDEGHDDARRELQRRSDLSLKFDGDWNFLRRESVDSGRASRRTPRATMCRRFSERTIPLTGYRAGTFTAAARARPRAGCKFGRRRYRSPRLALRSAERPIALAEPTKCDCPTRNCARDGTRRRRCSLPAARTDSRNSTSRARHRARKINALQTAVAAGWRAARFQFARQRAVARAVAQGDLHVTNLKLGRRRREISTASSHRTARTRMSRSLPELEREKLQGQLTVGLAGDEPVSGQLSVEQFDLDPLIAAGSASETTDRPQQRRRRVHDFRRAAPARFDRGGRGYRAHFLQLRIRAAHNDQNIRLSLPSQRSPHRAGPPARPRHGSAVRRIGAIRPRPPHRFHAFGRREPAAAEKRAAGSRRAGARGRERLHRRDDGSAANHRAGKRARRRRRTTRIFRSGSAM